MNGQMTELEAVNEVLAAVGDQPVQTLAAGTYIEAVRIQQILRNTSRRIQSKGWWFNEIENKTLQPDSGGFIYLGNNVIEVSVLDDHDGSIIQRGNRMYDRKNDTYIFSNPIKVDLRLNLEWNELPQIARSYFTILTTIEYNSGFVGRTDIVQKLNEDLFERRTAMHTSETDNRDINLLKNTRSFNVAFKNRR